MVLKINISKFSCILKMMPRNTFPEPQPDSASYLQKKLSLQTLVDKRLPQPANIANAVRKDFKLLFFCRHNFPPHSWFISMVDSNELCPVKPVKLYQSKYENMKIRGPSGAMMFLSITTHLPSFFKNSKRAACCECSLQVLQRSKRPLKRPLHTLRTT